MDTMVADPLNGALLDGRYRIRGRVARGGMATVYHATDERLERTVAIKIIHPTYARDNRFLARFADEAKTIARLTHPNVVAVYDQGIHDGMPYLVMEYVRGRTLREILAERRRLEPAEALAVLEQMLAAISIAHRAGLVHRDVKPENVLVAAPPNGSGNLVDAVVKVADFGLARAVEASAEDQHGQLMATVAYVAPELVTGSHVDSRADVYSAGIVLFEMLTGRVPYDGERPVDVAWQHVDRDVPAPSKLVAGLPPLVDELVARATRRDPGGRPMDAGAMLAEVSAAREDLGTQTFVAHVFAQPTMEIAAVDQRPNWARLPGGAAPPTRTMPRAAPAGGRGGRPPLMDNLRARVARLTATERNRRKLLAAAVAIGVVVLISGYWVGIGRYTDAPSLLNLTQANAAAEAKRLGFGMKVGSGIFSDTVPKDTVMQQNPAPGGRLVRGGEITVNLSLGPELYPVPEIAGQLASVGLESLKEHFKVQQINDYSDTLPKGYIISTDPAVGTQLPPGATVKVYVSKGDYPMHVPTVVGKNINEARAILEAEGLVVGKVEYVDNQSRPRDEVLEQDPAQGAGVVKGAKVNLKISNGPPGFPMPDVNNWNCGDAKRELERQNLRVQVQTEGFFGENGNVRGQQPAPGQPVQMGQEVVIQCRLF
ncbi:Stk1 family PASTA domain-containing Ser/Thr kinase [Luedemannella helvata]|uniref:non-specific serine/threonine protein kinase n=1 Tax=Luedemannella helvata TaxID=349315 RepID=A0ABP4W367_9ACTN